MNPEKQDRIDQVTALATKRLSAQEIAMQMHCTRNAIVGLCDRNGIMLLGRQRASRHTPATAHSEAMEAQQRREHALRHKVYKPSRILMWAGLSLR